MLRAKIENCPTGKSKTGIRYRRTLIRMISDCHSSLLVIISTDVQRVSPSNARLQHASAKHPRYKATTFSHDAFESCSIISTDGGRNHNELALYHRETAIDEGRRKNYDHYGQHLKTTRLQDHTWKENTDTSLNSSLKIGVTMSNSVINAKHVLPSTLQFQ
jgi:hypothetical protein